MISPALVSEIESRSGIRLLPETCQVASGGCIHESCFVEDDSGSPFFLKQNRSNQLSLFEAESTGLTLLEQSKTIRVPHPITHGTCKDRAFLLMEGLHLRSDSSDRASENLAVHLSRLHQARAPDDRFGLDSDNFIGATPQPNCPSSSWADFFTANRLEHQFQLASKLGKTFREQDALLSRVHGHLASLDIQPTLSHGDLWGGNAAFLEDAVPIVFDPAAYYADPETDIAFTHLFGGFTPRFYEAYRERHPAPEPEREAIYNLYHVLNHFVLFGGGYASQAERMITRLLQRL